MQKNCSTYIYISVKSNTNLSAHSFKVMRCLTVGFTDDVICGIGLSGQLGTCMDTVGIIYN